MKARFKTWTLEYFALGVFLLSSPLIAEAALNSPDLTIVTGTGWGEGHLIAFPYSTTTLSIDCATGTITTLSHDDPDHCGGDDQQWNPGNVYVGQVLYSDEAHGVKVTVVAANGHAIDGGSWGCVDDNACSMALWVRYGGFDYLTAGDMYYDGESHLGSWFNQQSANGINIDVLKASHHGTCTNGTSSESFLQNIRAEYVTISGTASGPCKAPVSCGGDNNTLPRFVAAGATKIYCIPDYDLSCVSVPPQVRNGTGDLTIRTDGQTLSISGNGFTDGPFWVDDFQSPTPSPTPEGWKTPTPSPTPIPTSTPTPSRTPPPTPTPTPFGWKTPTPTPTPPPPIEIFSESFNQGLPGSWMVIDGYDDGKTWTDTNPGGRFHAAWTPPFMIVDSDNAGLVAMDEQLITPLINCSSYEDIRLSFSHYYWHYSGMEKGDVDIRADGGEWQNLVHFTYTDSGLKDYDISAYADGKAGVEVRWHYYNAYYDWYWGIDDVVLRGTILITPTPTPTLTPTPTPTPLPGLTWYLAAGGTKVEDTAFDTYILIAVPGDEEARIKIIYVGPDGPFPWVLLTVQPGTRHTVNMKDYIPPIPPGQENVAAIVLSLNNVPIIVERAMYFPGGVGASAWIGGHNTIGLSQLGTDWFLAEGATHIFNQFVHILNPGTETAEVDVTFFNELGQSWTVSKVMDGMRVWAVKANDVADNQPQLSTRVTSTQPVAVDRTMYWPKGESNGWQDGHASFGVTEFSEEWFLPEGATHVFDEYILVANPSETEAADVDFFFTDQFGNTWTANRVIAPQQRDTVNVNIVAGTVNQVSTRIKSDIPVVAERAMYWPKGPASGWTGGHDTVGASSPQWRWQLPEGATHIFDEYVLVANPGETETANVTFTFRDNQSVIGTHVAVVEPQRRYTVKVNDVVGSVGQVWTTVEADIPVVAERAMYLPTGSPWETGHVTVGVGEE